MYYVHVPENVTIEGLAQQPDGSVSRVTREMSLKELVKETILVDTYFGKDVTKLIAATEIHQKFQEAKPGDFIELTDEQHKHIKAVLENPANGFNPHLGMQAISFFLALRNPLTSEQKKAKDRESQH